MRHVAAVAELDAGLGTFGVDGVGEIFKFGYYFFSHPELPVEGEAATRDGGVGHGGHADASAGHGGVVVKQLFRRTISLAHIFKSSRLRSG